MKIKILEIAPNLYNQIFKVNPDAPMLIKVLNLIEVGRFRDIFLNKDGTRIILYTRNGGKNRKKYQSIFDDLRKHPFYIRDWDDAYDNTYAYVEFSMPPKYIQELQGMATGIEPKSIGDKFKEVFKEMAVMTPRQMAEDQRFKSTIEMLNQITEEED